MTNSSIIARPRFSSRQFLLIVQHENAKVHQTFLQLKYCLIKNDKLTLWFARNENTVAKVIIYFKQQRKKRQKGLRCTQLSNFSAIYIYQKRQFFLNPEKKLSNRKWKTFSNHKSTNRVQTNIKYSFTRACACTTGVLHFLLSQVSHNPLHLSNDQWIMP